MDIEQKAKWRGTHPASPVIGGDMHVQGMTIREEIASRNLAALLANSKLTDNTDRALVDSAIDLADQLLVELEDTK